MTVGSSSGKVSVKIKKKPRVFCNQSGMVVRRLSDLADVDVDAKEMDLS